MIEKENQRQMIFEVYMDLSEGKKLLIISQILNWCKKFLTTVREWHNLNVKKLGEDQFVVTGYPLASSVENAVYPVSSHNEFSLGDITDILNMMKRNLQSPM